MTIQGVHRACAIDARQGASPAYGWKGRLDCRAMRIPRTDVFLQMAEKTHGIYNAADEHWRREEVKMMNDDC